MSGGINHHGRRGTPRQTIQSVGVLVSNYHGRPQPPHQVVAPLRPGPGIRRGRNSPVLGTARHLRAHLAAFYQCLARVAMAARLARFWLGWWRWYVLFFFCLGLTAATEQRTEHDGWTERNRAPTVNLCSLAARTGDHRSDTIHLCTTCRLIYQDHSTLVPGQRRCSCPRCAHAGVLTNERLSLIALLMPVLTFFRFSAFRNHNSSKDPTLCLRSRLAPCSSNSITNSSRSSGVASRKWYGRSLSP